MSSSARCGQRRDPEAGQVSILLVGLLSLALLLILGIVGVTSVQLSRIQLLDAADAAALDASDAITAKGYYRFGADPGVPVTDATVADAASEHLAHREMPPQVSQWELGQGTGTPDGRTAVVELRGTAQIPVLSRALAALGGSVTVEVTSSARSDLGG